MYKNDKNKKIRKKDNKKDGRFVVDAKLRRQGGVVW